MMEWTIQVTLHSIYDTRREKKTPHIFVIEMKRFDENYKNQAHFIFIQHATRQKKKEAFKI